MLETASMTFDLRGYVSDASTAACRLCGIPRQEMLGHPFAEYLIPEHRTRLSVEVAALADGLERHGRMDGTVMGSDGIGRRLVLVLEKTDASRIEVLISVPGRSGATMPRLQAGLDARHLLPLARQLTSLCRRALDKNELLQGTLTVMIEATSATGGAALDWSACQGEPPTITQGSFDSVFLQGLFRPAILARLTRGDVVIKDSVVGAGSLGLSLVVLPLLSGSSPEGFIVLCMEGYTVLSPEEQQAFAIAGEILGLGLRAIAGTGQRGHGPIPRRGDREATAALGKLSAGMTHEINNAITILGNYLEQFTLYRSRLPGTPPLDESVYKDLRTALEGIRDLVAGMRAFAPEESVRFDEINILRLLETVARAMRFHARRGIRIVFEHPKEMLPRVLVRSHHLIRSLFLLLIELVEAGEEAGVEMAVSLSLERMEAQLVLKVTVSAGPFSLPPVLLAQLEKGGALARHVTRAGATLQYSVDHKGSLCVSFFLNEARSRKLSMLPLPSMAPTRRGTILLVDDEVAVIRSLRRLLEREHDVLAASSADEALAIIGTMPSIDLVLYDISMTRMGAKEFMHRAERLSTSLSERIVFVSSGTVDSTDAAFLMEARNTVIEKPFDLSSLTDLIAAML
jgi:CheY-like chemotaxis protein